ncbi:hypothetical protein BHE90_002605 [Fusarium euwallaceae]|uniref:C2H2-type domain-containing protein n=1 Tax=Fusarium euwallaceae TaxID=1147111 RepID=A0A430M493_9HYPO|nr:hypothetical protein BHE90_002605 [Fusarium euwallaceae]
MEPNELCRRTEECLSLFQDVSKHQTLADDDWFEDRAADFVWWSHGLKAQKTGRSSLDYRLRDRPDIQKVIAGLLDSLAQALKECLRPDEGQGSIHDDLEDEASESEGSSSGSSWSEFSDEVNQSKDKNDSADTPATEDSDPRFYIETNLKLLAKISIAIRRSGAKLRYLKADAYLKAHSDDDEYTQLRNHLLFLILVGPYEQKLFSELRHRTTNKKLPKAVEIVIRSWIVDPSRATSNQQRLVEANITRRNRIAYARRFIGKSAVPTRSKEVAAPTIVHTPLPDAVLQPTKEPSIFGADAQEPFPVVDPIEALPISPEPAKSLTVKTLTATELGSQFVLPVIVPFEPKKGAMSVATKMTQTGIKQDYPVCPGKKGSFQCPYCVQVLPEDYTAKSRWRGHVAQDLNPYSCIYQDCPDSHDLYATKEEWIKHIRSQHNEERWVCDDCIFESDQDDEFIFDSQELWESHMRSHHSCPDDRLTLLCSMSKRKLVQLAECPLCKRSCGHSRPDEDDHIAEHLHSWALRALPWDLNPDDEASSDSPEMGSENDLARMSEMSELPEDEADSLTATMSDAIGREVTRWKAHQTHTVLSDRFYSLASTLEDIIGIWSVHAQLDTQNETVLQHLMSINQARAQLSQDSEFTAQQRRDMEDNLCINIEVSVEYMTGVLSAEEEEPSREPSIDLDEPERPETPPRTPPPPVVGIPRVDTYDGKTPRSDDEKGDILENARERVLYSKDPGMQLAWARDVLVWAMTAEKVRLRESEPRPVPDTEQQLRTSALDIMMFLAQQGHSEALYHEGKWLELGQFGRTVDIGQAFDRYRRAADGGLGRAHYRLGKLCQQAWDDWEAAFTHYEKGEQLGDAAASLQLAFRYLHSSHFEEPDLKKGLALLKQSADNADEDAPQGAYVYALALLGNLPDLATDEYLLPTDTSMAFMYMEKSAYLGYSKAQWRMGVAYETGTLSCRVDAAKSIHYYHLAARQGWGTAAYDLSRWFLPGTSREDQVVPDPALSFKFAQWGAFEGDGGSKYMMGWHYETGTHVLPDFEEARKWYKRASHHLYSDAGQLSREKLVALEERDEFFFGVGLDGRSHLGPRVEPRTLVVAMDVGEMFSFVSWADPLQPFDIEHLELFSYGQPGFQPHSQIPTQYDPETGAWGNPFLQAARLRKFTATQQQSCFSLWKDLRSNVDSVRGQALGVLRAHVRELWLHFYSKLVEISGYFHIVISLSVPLGFTWDSRDQIRDIVWHVADGWTTHRLIRVDLMEPMDAAILNALTAQHGREQPPGGPMRMIKSGDVVVVCDCGGTGVRTVSYEVVHGAPPLVHQLTKSISEEFGKHSVDMEFIDYLLNRSGLSWRTSSKSARDELDRLIVEEWEYGIKRTFRGDERDDINLQVPRRATSVIGRLRRTSSTLSIQRETVLNFFATTLMSIEATITSQLAELETIGRKPNSIVLVGGMALSPCVYRYLSEEFDITIRRPDMDGRSFFSRGVVELEYQHSVANRSPFLAEVE